MRDNFNHLSRYRVRHGELASSESDGRNGMFLIRERTVNERTILRCIVSDGEPEYPWEHVSVSVVYLNTHGKQIGRTPTWGEMCHVKSLFWEPEEMVMQLHPPQSEWINNHEHCLHLWKPLNAEIPKPPGILVGIKDNEKTLDTLQSS